VCRTGCRSRAGARGPSGLTRRRLEHSRTGRRPGTVVDDGIPDRPCLVVPGAAGHQHPPSSEPESPCAA
jgi:hypothetical protein